MIKAHQKLTSAAIAIAFSAVVSSQGAEPKWQQKMKDLADTMGQLMPELFATKGDPKIIKAGAKKLSKLTHGLKEGSESGKMMPPADFDPSLAFIADQFSTKSQLAYREITKGHTEYGKALLRSVTQYCIACHTRHEKGPGFISFPMSERANQLGKAEKAELLIATRQFDSALTALQELITSAKDVGARPFDWDRQVRNALMISVRVKNDSATSLGIVDSALKVSTVPEFEKNRLSKWKKAIQAWQAEGPSKASSESQYQSEMNRLMKEAQKAQLYPLDRGAEIQYLRASAAAHDVLRTAKDPQVIQEALLVAGTSYEVLSNPALWPMHEFYYEACIKKLPHSELARQCYTRLEESVYFGYSGSAGERVPEAVKKNLDQLRELSEVKADEKK